jgi:hypothetical protein
MIDIESLIITYKIIDNNAQLTRRLPLNNKRPFRTILSSVNMCLVKYKHTIHALFKGSSFLTSLNVLGVCCHLAQVSISGAFRAELEARFGPVLVIANAVYTWMRDVMVCGLCGVIH